MGAKKSKVYTDYENVIFQVTKYTRIKLFFSFVHNLCRLNFLQCEIYILIIYYIKTFDTHQAEPKSVT